MTMHIRSSFAFPTYHAPISSKSILLFEQALSVSPSLNRNVERITHTYLTEGKPLHLSTRVYQPSNSNKLGERLQALVPGCSIAILSHGVGGCSVDLFGWKRLGRKPAEYKLIHSLQGTGDSIEARRCDGHMGAEQKRMEDWGR